MEGEDLNPLYEILESSSNFWLPPSPSLTSLDGLLTPQNSLNKNLDTITTPSPPLSRSQPSIGVAVDVEIPQNLNSNAGVEKPTSGKRSDRDKMKQKEKETWYKGPWTSQEDRKLINLVNRIGLRKWASVAEHMARRIGKQCRERWHNNLRPNIRKSVVWSDEEERMIMEGHKKFGNKWSEIAKYYVPGRSENAVKNHWNSIKRRLSSKRRIKRPAATLYESNNILENYIKNKFFITSTNVNAAPPPPSNDAHATFSSAASATTDLPHLNVDDDSNADNGAAETTAAVDEDVLSFLTSLFGNINGSDQETN